MAQITRQTNAPDTTVLAEITKTIQANFPKTDIEHQANEVTARRKVLWQKQEAIFRVAGGTLTAVGNCQDSDKIVYRTIEAITPLLDDHGWDDAARTHGTRSVAKGGPFKDKVLGELVPGERVVVATRGFYEGKPTVLAVTDQRILLISDTALGWDATSQTIALDKVSSISEKTGFALGSIRVSTSNDEIEIEKVATDEVQAVVAATRRAMTSSPASNQAPAAGGNAAELKNLAELHAAGVLTDEEFAAAKARILGI